MTSMKMPLFIVTSVTTLNLSCQYKGGTVKKNLILMDPCVVDYSVEIRTRCGFVIEFIIPRFLNAHHVSSGTPLIIRSSRLYLQSLVFMPIWWPTVTKVEWALDHLLQSCILLVFLLSTLKNVWVLVSQLSLASYVLHIGCFCVPQFFNTLLVWGSYQVIQKVLRMHVQPSFKTMWWSCVGWLGLVNLSIPLLYFHSVQMYFVVSKDRYLI
jgi:hypothetical protein